MAAKTPDTIKTVSLGDLKLTIATFTTTNLDDNDTWTSGIKSKVGHFFGPEIDGSDIAIDAYDNSDGKLTFGCSANWEGQVYVLSQDY